MGSSTRTAPLLRDRLERHGAELVAELQRWLRWRPQPEHEPTPDGHDPVPEPLLTPEERIVGLLEANDGAMRQKELATSVDWSKSTVSRRLAGMERSGTLTRYRIGREKLVVMPGAGPAVLGPSFEADAGVAVTPTATGPEAPSAES